MTLEETKSSLLECSREMSVLYAEDEEGPRDALTAALERFFKRVQTARNGEEAWKMYSAESFDLVITDLEMPGMHGVELARKIKEDRYDQMVLVLSAHHELQHLSRLLNAGVDGFLVKPFDPEALVVSLHRITRIIADRKTLVSFQSKLEESYIEIMEQKEALERTLKRAEHAENRAVALSVAARGEVEISQTQLDYLAMEFKPMSAREFQEKYPFDLESKSDLLEHIDDQLDLLISKFRNDPGESSMHAVGDALNQFVEAIRSLAEFSNLIHGLEHLASILLKSHTIADPAHVADLLLNISSSLKEWRTGVFVDMSTDNIHYLDNSMISDALLVESAITGKKIAREEDDELELF